MIETSDVMRHALALTLLGCGASSPATIHIPIVGDPTAAYVALHDGHVWTPLRPDGRGSYEISTDSDYEVVVICAQGSSGQASEAFGTPSDPLFPLFGCPDGRADFVTVTASLDEAATVHLGPFFAGQGSSAPWVDTSSVPTGQYDLLAAGSDRLVIRRGLHVDTDESLDAIDLSMGSPLTPTSVTVVGGASDSVISSFYETKATYDSFGIPDGVNAGVDISPAFLSRGNTSGGSGTVLTATSASGDIQGLSVSASSPTDGPTHFQDATSLEVVAEIDLPEVLEASFDESVLSASWNGGALAASIGLQRRGGFTLNLVASAAWLSDHETPTALSFDSTFPEFGSAWYCQGSGCVDELEAIEQSPTLTRTSKTFSSPQ
jgi:hypothetical protein|nr:hypothetical protein [Kofleriaceae bacterium]